MSQETLRFAAIAILSRSFTRVALALALVPGVGFAAPTAGGVTASDEPPTNSGLAPAAATPMAPTMATTTPPTSSPDATAAPVAPNAAAPAVAPTSNPGDAAAVPATPPTAPVAAPQTANTSDGTATESASSKPEDPWEASGWYLALDRLTGIGGWSLSRTEPNGVAVSETGNVAALAGGGVNTGASVPLNPYAVPRLSLDRKISPRATLGIGFAGIATNGDISAELNGVSQSEQAESRWLIAVTPRLGYLIPTTSFLTFWIRAGGTYAVQRTYNPVVDARAKLASVDVEAVALFRLGGRFAVSTSLALALPVYGHYEYHVAASRAEALNVPTDSERNFSLTCYMAHLGVLVAL